MLKSLNKEITFDIWSKLFSIYTCIHQNSSKKQRGMRMPISLRWRTNIFLVQGASLGSVSRACFCFSSNFCPSRKYFFMKLDTFESRASPKGCFILDESKTECCFIFCETRKMTPVTPGIYHEENACFPELALPLHCWIGLQGRTEIKC